MLSKILALYLENLVFCGLWMLPTGAAYLVYAGLGAGQAAGFCVRLLAAALFCLCCLPFWHCWGAG